MKKVEGNFPHILQDKKFYPLLLVLSILILVSSSISSLEKTTSNDYNEFLVDLEEPPAVPDIERGMSREERTEILKERSRISQENFKQAVENNQKIDVKNTYWVNNRVLIKTDKERTDVLQLPQVEEVNPNIKFEHPDIDNSEPGKSTETQETETAEEEFEKTYGLEQINASKVWESYGTKGDNTKVAVLDTGIDPDHPDLEITEENFNDFIEGNEEPYDKGEHGTHVSGTVFGGNESGEWIGVAPETEGIHGIVCDEENCYGDAIEEGIDWAVDNEADVISMSFGGPGYACYNPLEGVKDAGVMPVAASGNDGYSTSYIPGNNYDVFAVGASNSEKEIAEFSSGEQLESDDFEDCSSDWPDTFMAPQVSAPGSGVNSALPGGDYGFKSGTSMAAPHVSGAVALIQSASTEELDPWDIREVLEETAWKPPESEWQEFIDEETDEWNGDYEEPDPRYGYGIIDVYDALQEVEAFQKFEDCGKLEEGFFRLSNSFSGEDNCIELDKAVVDGDGNMLEGSSGTGLTVLKDSFVENMRLEGWDTSIEVEDSFEADNITVEGQKVSLDGYDFSLTEGEKPESLPDDMQNISGYIDVEGNGQLELGLGFETSKDTEKHIFRHDGTDWIKEETEIEEGKAYGDFSEFSTFTVARELEPEDFKITDEENNTPIVEDHTFETSVKVENTGELEATQKINLEKSGEVRDYKEITLDPDEEKEVGLETVLEQPGNKELNITTENDTKTGEATVFQQPEFAGIKPEDQKQFGVNESKIEFSADISSEEEADVELIVEEQVKDASAEKEEVNFFEEFEEGTYNWKLNYTGIETGYQFSSEERRFDVEESADLDLLSPGNEEVLEPGTTKTDLEYEVVTETSGELELFLNDETVLTETHEKGSEQYGELVEVGEGEHEWRLEFESEEGNHFESEERSFEVEETDINPKLEAPENETVLGFPERKQSFEYGVETNVDVFVSLLLNGSEKKVDEVSSDSNLQELENSLKLDPGTYNWNVEAESGETGDVNKTGNRTIEVEEPEINHSLNEPEDESFIEWEDRETNFTYEVMAEDSAETRIVLNEDKLHEESIEDTDTDLEINKTHKLDPGSYEWYVETETDFNKQSSDEKTFEVEEPELDVDIQVPEGTYNYTERELEFNYSIYSSESGNLTAYLDDKELRTEDFEESTDFSFSEEIDSGSYEWRVEAETDSDKFKTREADITVEEPVLEVTDLRPEDGEEVITSGELTLEAQVFSEEEAETTVTLEDLDEEEEKTVYDEKISGSKTLEIKEDVDPGEYNWTLTAEDSYNSLESSQIFEAEELVEFSSISPDGETFDEQTEEVELVYSLETSYSGDAEIVFDGGTELAEEHNKGESDYSVSVEVQKGEIYEWTAQFASNSGETFTETLEFEVDEEDDEESGSDNGDETESAPPPEPTALCEETDYSFNEGLLEFCIPENEELEFKDFEPVEKLIFSYTDEIESEVKLESYEPETRDLVFEEGFQISTNDSLKADIYFSVEDDWMKEEGLKPENISLYREEERWESVDTSYEGDNMFVSEEVGLSSFGYGGEQQEEIDAIKDGECETFPSRYYLPDNSQTVEDCAEWEADKERVSSRINEVESDKGTSNESEEALELLEQGELEQAEAVIDDAETREEDEEDSSNILTAVSILALLIISISFGAVYYARNQEEETDKQAEELKIYSEEIKDRIANEKHVDGKTVDALEKATKAFEDGRKTDLERYLRYIREHTDIEDY